MYIYIYIVICVLGSPNKNLKHPWVPFGTSFSPRTSHKFWTNVGTSNGFHLEAPPVLPG